MKISRPMRNSRNSERSTGLPTTYDETASFRSTFLCTHHGPFHRTLIKHIPHCILISSALWLVLVLHHHTRISAVLGINSAIAKSNDPSTLQSYQSTLSSQRERRDKVSSSLSSSSGKRVISGFENVLQRSQEMKLFCEKEQGAQFSGFDSRYELPLLGSNGTVAALPAFGLIRAITEHQEKLQGAIQAMEDYRTELQRQQRNSVNQSSAQPPRTGTDDINLRGNQWQCQLPPETECEEKQFTVIFMAYNPDRLGKTLRQINLMLDENPFHGLVKECIIVWNGERHIDESQAGKDVLTYEKTNPTKFRIVYPLRMGFPNDLMNRYHPDIVKVTTKAIMYYDDDGPFYSYKATEAGFELWKRHSSAQIGAMARQIDYGPRQVLERQNLDFNPNDQLFVSHCDNLGDKLEYNFRHFANYDANMVLPSGSFLHANYLCFLWHPILAEIRRFVLLHPVHPDDVTVSTVVSHLSGRAPRVYSRKLNSPSSGTSSGKSHSDSHRKNKKRKLSERYGSGSTVSSAQLRRSLLSQTWSVGMPRNGTTTDIVASRSWSPFQKLRDYANQTLLTTMVSINNDIRLHRRLAAAGMGGICWDCGSGMTDQKKLWASLRSSAIQSLVRYFGGINSGSIGWCEGTTYYDGKAVGKCVPTFATEGWLPWMKVDGTPKDQCP